MRKVDVLYSLSSGQSVSKALGEIPKYVRVERLTSANSVIIFIDKNCKWDQHKKTVLLADLCSKLVVGGCEPFLITHTVHEPEPVVVKMVSGKVTLQYDTKHHFEQLEFDKREVVLVHTKKPLSGGMTIVKKIWLTGSHRHVRDVRRYVRNKLTNGNKILYLHDIERIQQIAGTHANVYMQFNSGRIVDISKQQLVPSTIYEENELGGYLNNVRKVWLADTAKPNSQTHIWNSIFCNV